MNALIRKVCPRRGFTVVEVLTTVAIISLLIALFIPAINKVSEVAGRVRQKAQLSNIEVGLEAYSSDYGDYPMSYNNPPIASGPYTGAQVLGEAIVGMDGFGLHPDSVFSPDRLDGSAVEIYYPGISGLTQPEQDANVQSRTGAYLENDAANAVRVVDIYDDAGISDDGKVTMVLADMFTKKMRTGIKTGMPILYFKADSLKTGHTATPTLPATLQDNRYKYGHNYAILDLGAPWGPASHPMFEPVPYIFYRKTQDPRFTVKAQPYRSKSFILLSAGKDGLYGTADDVYNFERVEQ